MNHTESTLPDVDTPPGPEPAYAAFVGIDWADQQHAVALLDPQSGTVTHENVAQTPEALDDWALQLLQRFGGLPIAVALEQSRGALIYALMKYPHLVPYPVPPARLAAYRQAFTSSGAKDDPTDADLVLDYLVKHRQALRPWRPDCQQTRHLQLLVEQRRKIVDQRTALSNQLTAQLKCTFPQAIDWLGDKIYTRLATDFLLKWPDLQSLQRSKIDTVRRFFYAHNLRRGDIIEARLDQMRTAKPLVDDPALLAVGQMTVKALAGLLRQLVDTVAGFEKQIQQVFADHDDAPIFSSLPGAGKALSPRLACAFGSDRGRFTQAQDMQIFSGIAPVTKRSGKTMLVQRRWACPTFVKQTFHEFAGCSIGRSIWAKSFYDLQRSRGKGHHAAVRSLASKWIRIIVACWHARTPYDEARYLAQLRLRRSPLLQYLPSPE
ncbi:MAG TPA: IS110 family transposase [Anaerolineales bacterium]